jgi:uncharacterized Rossmann fold enzyme
LRYEEWAPIYREIAREFGFSADADRDSARLLVSLIDSAKVCPSECLARTIGDAVTVCGNGPDLDSSLEGAALQGTVIAADAATGHLMGRGVLPDVIVTDLDGEIGPQVEANSRGSVAVIHAHGDNMEAIRSHVPRFKGRVAPTTQVESFDSVVDYGGFTDGDRAVILARHFGATRICLVGFDFERPTGKGGRAPDVKTRKRAWARHLIFDLNPPSVSLSTL